MQDRDSVYEDPFWEAYQFEDEELSISKAVVARGQFGVSYELGRIRPNKPLPSKINTMAMMKSCAENEEGNSYNALKSEMNILYDLAHQNVIQLVGYCLIGNLDVCKLVLVFEYCSNGNLIKVLQKGRPYYNAGTYCPKKAINNETISQSPEISLNFCDWYLLRWATEIVRGMEYLAFKGVVHGDLAARNVLLTCDWTAKICNFGIAQRQNRQKSYATNLSKEVLPIAWMSPETIQNFTYSEQSDVWSFAITLWEIYTLGEIPYKKENVVLDTKFFVLLLQDLRPTRPILANIDMWKLMKSCWSFQSESRPTFSKIKTFLDRNFLASKSQREGQHSPSGHSINSNSNLAVATPEENNSEKSKTVSFDTLTVDGFIRKCSHIAEEVLSRTRIKSNSS